MIPENDWRRQGQEEYLKGATLVHRPYRQNPNNPKWDHDHCEFCWATFSLFQHPEHLKVGYATEDDYRWICPACYVDFKDEFDWSVREEMNTEQGVPPLRRTRCAEGER